MIELKKVVPEYRDIGSSGASGNRKALTAEARRRGGGGKVNVLVMGAPLCCARGPVLA